MSAYKKCFTLAVISSVMIAGISLPEATGAFRTAHAADPHAAGLTTIGYSVIDRNDHFDNMIKAVTKAASAMGIRVLVSEPAFSAVKQVNQVKDMVNNGAQVIIIASVDPVAVEAGVTYAHTHNVPVISDISGFRNADAYVGFSECAWGTDVGTYTGKWWVKTRPHQAAYIWEANADDLGGDLPKRTDCMVQAFKGQVANSHLVADITAWKQQIAYNAMSDVLNAHPNVNLMLGSDTLGVEGAISALKARGKVSGKDIVFSTVDWDPQILRLIKRGDVLATGYTNEPVEGPVLVNVAKKLFAGRYPKGARTLFKTSLITKQNVDSYLPH